MVEKDTFSFLFTLAYPHALRTIRCDLPLYTRKRARGACHLAPVRTTHSGLGIVAQIVGSTLEFELKKITDKPPTIQFRPDTALS